MQTFANSQNTDLERGEVGRIWEEMAEETVNRIQCVKKYIFNFKKKIKIFEIHVLKKASPKLN